MSNREIKITVNGKPLQVSAETSIDQLLEKIQQHGMESLTDTERRNLQRASALFREKGKPAP